MKFKIGRTTFSFSFFKKKITETELIQLAAIVAGVIYLFMGFQTIGNLWLATAVIIGACGRDERCP